jgi:hypothetical protein
VYLKNSSYRTGASVAIAIAAAAGVGTASATAGAGPWASSLNSLAFPGHSASDNATADQAKSNVFHAVLPASSGTPASDTPASGSPASGGQPAAPQASGVRLADQQKPAASDSRPKSVTQSNQSAPGGQPSKGLAALRPIRARAKAQQPAASHATAVAHKAAAPRPARPSAPAQPYTIYDSVNPGAIPSGQSRVAVYGNGQFQASWSAVHGRNRVLWIDTNGSNPGCDVLDVEPGDATPSGAAQWVKTRLAKQPGHIAIVYTMRSEWSAVKDAIGGLPGSMQSQVRYWIADPTGVPHVVPGSSATQWYWGANFDETTALPGFGQ